MTLNDTMKATKHLNDVNETTVQASHDTGTCFSVVKCTEIVFEHKMVKGEGLKIKIAGRKNENYGHG